MDNKGQQKEPSAYVEDEMAQWPNTDLLILGRGLV